MSAFNPESGRASSFRPASVTGVKPMTSVVSAFNPESGRASSFRPASVTDVLLRYSKVRDFNNIVLVPFVDVCPATRPVSSESGDQLLAQFFLTWVQGQKILKGFDGLEDLLVLRQFHMRPGINERAQRGQILGHVVQVPAQKVDRLGKVSSVLGGNAFTLPGHELIVEFAPPVFGVPENASAGDQDQGDQDG